MIKETDVDAIGLKVSAPDPILDTPLSVNPDEFFRKKSTFLESIDAAFSMENDVYSTYTFRVPPEIQEKIVSGFNALDNGQYDISGYDEYAEEFANVYNREHADILKQNIDRQRHYNDILENDGARGIALSILAGVLSPTSLFPAGTAFRGYKLSSNVFRGATRTAASAVAAVGVSEAILHSAQETRTAGQSAVNITGAALLGGLLGGAVSFYKTGGYLKAAKNLDDALKAPPMNPGSVGAMEVKKFSKEQLTPKTALGYSMRQHILNDLKGKLDKAVQLGDAKVADDISKQINNIDEIRHAKDVDLFEMVALGPGQRLEANPIEDFRLMGRMLERNTSMMRANDELIGSPISSEAQINSFWEKTHHYSAVELGQAWYEYARGVQNAGAVRQKVGGVMESISNKVRKNRRFSRKEFAEHVSYASRNGDVFDKPVDAAYKSAVEKGARTFRKYADVFLKESKDVGLLREDFFFDSITAESWVHRRYNVQKIKDDPNGFARTVIDGMRGPRSPYKKIVVLKTEKVTSLKKDLIDIKDTIKRSSQEDIEKLTSELNKKNDALSNAKMELKEASDNWKWVQEASEAELRSITDETALKIRGDVHASPRPSAYSGRSGEFKQRTLLIEDNLISDYLENDIDIIMSGMKYRMAPEIEITRAFGDVDIEKSSIFQMAKDKYLAKLANTTDAAEAKRLNRAWEIGKRDLLAIKDKILGVYGVPKDPYSFFPRLGYEIRKHNFIAQMGNVVPASISDLGKPIFAFGFKRYAQHLAAISMSPRLWKLSAKDAQKLGAATDLMSHARSLALAELADDHNALTKYERLTKGVSDNYSLINLSDFWNSGNKQFSSVMAQDTILETALDIKKGKFDIKNAKWLASYGLGRDELSDIADQWLKGGGEKIGEHLYLSRADIWPDQAVARKYMAAVVSIVDDIIVTPGKGDMPNILSGVVGKQIAQFSSFSVSSVRRTLQTGLQRHDMFVIEGVAAMMAWGAVSYGVRSWLRGEEVKKDRVLLEAFDASGLAGAYFSYPMMLNRSFGDPLGLNLYRYRAQPQFGALLGPTVGNMERGWDVAGGLIHPDEKMTDSDIHKGRQLLWFQNLFYTRWLFDHLEENIKEAKQ